MTAATVLRTARTTAGVTQSKLARRAKVPQPRVSEVERGHADPSVRRMSHLLEACGHRLVLIPTTADPVYEAAQDIAARLHRGDMRGAFRRFIQLSDDLAREPLHVRVALSASPPPPVGHAGFDAALAALVEYRTKEAGTAVPPWVWDESRVAGEGWAPSLDPVLAEYAQATAPEPFRRRGVWISSHDLESV